MRTTNIFLAASAIAATAVVAVAAPAAPRLSDADFIAANRCLGLMTSKGLASPDAGAIKALLKAQTVGRVDYIFDKADEARDNGQREGNQVGAASLPGLTAERDGLCHHFVAQGQSIASGPQSGRNS